MEVFGLTGQACGFTIDGYERHCCRHSVLIRQLCFMTFKTDGRKRLNLPITVAMLRQLPLDGSPDSAWILQQEALQLIPAAVSNFSINQTLPFHTPTFE